MRKLSFLLPLIACILFVSKVLQAQTIITDSIINTPTVWNAAGSPYIVKTDLYIQPEGNLEIQSGTEVLFDGYYFIRLYGELSVLGTENDSVSFSPTDSSGGIWGGILVMGDSVKPIEINYLKGSKAGGLLMFQANPTVQYQVDIHNSIFDSISYIMLANDSINIDVSISHVQISNYSIGFNGGPLFGKVQMNHLQMINGSHGVTFTNAVSPEKYFLEMDSCYIDSCNNMAIGAFNGFIKNSTITRARPAFGVYGPSTIWNNEIINNVEGFFFALDTPHTSNLSISDNRICYSRDYAVFGYYGPPFIDMSYNCWCTTDVDSIAASIFDYHDNPQYDSVVFLPLHSDCDALQLVEAEVNNVDFIAYPNPIYTYQTLYFNQVVSGRLLDLSGRTYLRFSKLHQLDISHLNPGMYLLQSDQHQHQLKLLIME